MAFEFEIPSHHRSIIKVIGVGGGGSNAVNYMHSIGITNVEFIVCNTDIQALHSSTVKNQLQIGIELTKGLGAGSDPSKGRDAAQESSHQIRELLRSDDTKMLFITAGMGGGTGTGAAPIIAKIAKELDILTVGIVTVPFNFEGKAKMQKALDGIDQLKKNCDSVITILNEKLIEIYGNLSQSKAFEKADNIIATGAKCIAEIVTVPGKINVDFEDVKTVMKNAGTSVMGSAESSGENRAKDAVEKAINSPLLNDRRIDGARKILLNIVSGGGENELSTIELDIISKFIHDSASTNVDFIFGTSYDGSLEDKIKVTVIATGFSTNETEQLSDNILENKIDGLMPESQINLFDSDTENNEIEFLSSSNQEEEVVHDIDDDYEEDEDILEPEYSESNINDRSENVIIEELDSVDDSNDKFDISNKKNEYLLKREDRINDYKNQIYDKDSYEEKLAIPAFKRKNINLSTDDDIINNNTKTINFNEED